MSRRHTPINLRGKHILQKWALKLIKVSRNTFSATSVPNIVCSRPFKPRKSLLGYFWRPSLLFFNSGSENHFEGQKGQLGSKINFKLFWMKTVTAIWIDLCTKPNFVWLAVAIRGYETLNFHMKVWIKVWSFRNGLFVFSEVVYTQTVTVIYTTVSMFNISWTSSTMYTWATQSSGSTHPTWNW